MQPFTLRPLDARDAAAAAALIRAAFADQGGSTSPPSSALNETSEIVAQKLGQGGGLAAEVDGELAGLVLYAPDGDALYLGRLAVAPHRRGEGLAAWLMRAVEAEARRLGFARTRLRVRLELPENRRLFARLGYQQAATGAHAGFTRPTFAVLEKRLEGA